MTYDYIYIYLFINMHSYSTIYFMSQSLGILMAVPRRVARVRSFISSDALTPMVGCERFLSKSLKVNLG